jgi:hypothetical protein
MCQTCGQQDRETFRRTAPDRLTMAACAPSLYPGTDIMTGVGPIMDAVRQRLRERLATIKGEPAPTGTIETPTAIILPPAEAMPFVSGPQLDLFGIAA